MYGQGVHCLDAVHDQVVALSERKYSLDFHTETMDASESSGIKLTYALPDGKLTDVGSERSSVNYIEFRH